MQYIGSKNRISNELIPIIQSYITKNTKGYLEPFVGGANVIDKIQHYNKIGCDIHKELIALLIKARDNVEEMPNEITFNEYVDVKNNKEKYEPWYVGLVGFCATFGSKYFGGYARNTRGDNTDTTKTKRGINALKKQAANLKGIRFENCNFLDIPIKELKEYVIYCDIPYRGSTKYATKKFPYDEFYQWVKEMSKYNTVLISEYSMPEEFECIWQKETKVNFDCNRGKGNEKNKRIEKLFIYNR